MLSVSACPTYAQPESEYALIRRPVFQNPMIWKMTKEVTNTHWDIDLFEFPRASAQSCIMDPEYELYSAVKLVIVGQNPLVVLPI